MAGTPHYRGLKKPKKKHLHLKSMLIWQNYGRPNAFEVLGVFLSQVQIKVLQLVSNETKFATLEYDV